MIEERKIGWMAAGVFGIMMIALIYGAIQINMSYSFLRSHSRYVHERDAVWAPMLQKIEGHMDRQDADAERILKNQRAILERLK